MNEENRPIRHHSQAGHYVVAAAILLAAVLLIVFRPRHDCCCCCQRHGATSSTTVIGQLPVAIPPSAWFDPSRQVVTTTKADDPHTTSPQRAAPNQIHDEQTANYQLRGVRTNDPDILSFPPGPLYVGIPGVLVCRCVDETGKPAPDDCNRQDDIHHNCHMATPVPVSEPASSLAWMGLGATAIVGLGLRRKLGSVRFGEA